MVKKLLANAGDIKTQVRSLGQEDPVEEGMATHSHYLPGESVDRGCSPQGFKESDTTEMT